MDKSAPVSPLLLPGVLAAALAATAPLHAQESETTDFEEIAI